MPVQPESVLPSTSPRSFRKLPERPDLDQLKTQARELLRRVHDGDADASAEVGRYFNADPDKPMTLAEAQLVLARSHGYDSWPKLKAFVDGVNKQALVDAIDAGDLDAVRGMLRRRPELANATTGVGEEQMIHRAVYRNDAPMLRLLMDHGADARRGIYPLRDSTTALAMATERGLDELVAVIRNVEAQRQEELSCPNVTISPAQLELAGLIRSGRDDEALALLDADPTLAKQCDLDGATPLHIACEVANEAVVEGLLRHRADPNKPDAAGHTALDRCVLGCAWVSRDRVEAARRIMHRLRGVGATWTPLGAAAMGEIDALQRMHAETPARLTDGFQWNRGGVLSAAAIFGQRETAAALLDLGLDANEPIPLGRQTDDEEAWSWGGPLWRAALYGHLELARLLLDRGADPNACVYASGWPLDRAYERGDRAMVDLLYERGAKPSAYTVAHAHDLAAAERLVDELGDDPVFLRELLWSAAFNTCLPIVELVLPKLAARVDQLAPDQFDRHDLLVQPLRGGRPNENIRTDRYDEADRFTIMRTLLDTFGEPDAQNRFGLTALHFITGRKDVDVLPTARRRLAEILLDGGADPGIRDDLLDSTALGWACRYGRSDLVRLYLERGVPVDEPDTPAWAQPMAWAEKMGHAELVTLLQAG
ncbi:MAG: ankyrin repeat domain-containing protein [Planctomycetota bacterium]